MPTFTETVYLTDPDGRTFIGRPGDDVPGWALEPDAETGKPPLGNPKAYDSGEEPEGDAAVTLRSMSLSQLRDYCKQQDPPIDYSGHGGNKDSMLELLETEGYDLDDPVEE